MDENLNKFSLIVLMNLENKDESISKPDFETAISPTLI